MLLRSTCSFLDSSGEEKVSGHGPGNKKKTTKKKKDARGEDEAGEETDEGDMESREVDYMSDSSTNSELEFLVCVSCFEWVCSHSSISTPDFIPW